MTRKVGVSQTLEKDFILNEEVSVVAEVMLKNICGTRDLCGLPRKTIVNDAMLRAAL